MSSTNRSNAREEHIADYYKTPVNTISAFLDAAKSLGIIKTPILDPCAGGVAGRESMSYPEALVKFGVSSVDIDTVDIRDDSPADCHFNYLQANCKGYNTIITNPPFNQAQAIIEKALQEVNDSGYVIMLLRLNYFESKARKDFFDSYMPKYCFVYRHRMSFTPDGKSDSIAHAHFVWQKNYSPEYTMLKVIG